MNCLTTLFNQSISVPSKYGISPPSAWRVQPYIFASDRTRISNMLSISFVLLLIGAHAALGDDPDTCGLTQKDHSNTFIIPSESPSGNIPLIHIQFDTQRKLPITSTVIYDKLNLIQNVNREDDFRMINCEPLVGNQQNCSYTMRLSVRQKEKVDAEYNSWDRGHLTPVNPMRFSADAVNATFFCVNIAPQEPWSNRCPWYAIEERTLSRTKDFPSYVMTGTCHADNVVDGTTYYGLIVPDCYWKMQCYVDPETHKTVVVAFVGNNTLIDGTNRERKGEDRLQRREDYLTPQNQQVVRQLMGSSAKFINRAWIAAEKELTNGREITGRLPAASTCGRIRDLPEEVKEEWIEFIKKHRPPPNCEDVYS